MSLSDNRCSSHLQTVGALAANDGVFRDGDSLTGSRLVDVGEALGRPLQVHTVLYDDTRRVLVDGVDLLLPLLQSEHV